MTEEVFVQFHDFLEGQAGPRNQYHTNILGGIIVSFYKIMFRLNSLFLYSYFNLMVFAGLQCKIYCFVIFWIISSLF